MQKVLVVDDDPEIRTLYRLALCREGLEVIEATSGHEAIYVAKVETPDLVLLDVMMPEMSGYEVCRRLRADPKTAHMPIIIISAKATTADRRIGLMSGANDFMVKTVSIQQIVARVRSFIPVSGGFVPARSP